MYILRQLGGWISIEGMPVVMFSKELNLRVVTQSHCQTQLCDFLPTKVAGMSKRKV